MRTALPSECARPDKTQNAALPTNLLALEEARWDSVWTPSTLDARTHDLYRARLARVRAFMRRAGVPALLIVDPNNILYATGARNMMVICLESYIGSPAAGQGIKLENQYLVHDTGVECLSPHPWDRRMGR